MPDARPTASKVTDVAASCDACEFHAEGLNALALAARHYDHTGHPVQTLITRHVRYGTPADLDRARRAAGQQALNVGDPA